MTTPTKNAIKREALRLFPDQPRFTTVSVGRLPLREGWLCTVRLPGGADLSTTALTKHGAMAEAYDLLRGLKPAVDACEACGDCLLPEPPRCERHVHTEPGDEEWTMAVPR